MAQTTELAIRWGDETRTLASGSDLSFGRASELSLDDNPYLHRQVGRFVEADDTGWSVVNDARIIDLRVTPTGAGTSIDVAPGESSALPPAGRIVFRAGSTTYQIDFEALTPDNTDEVIDITVPELGRRDLRVLLALCEARLLNPGSERVLVPGVSQVASRLALSLEQVNSAINSLTDAYRQGADSATDGAGAREDDHGLEGVVRWAVDQGLVDAGQLGSLNQPVTQLIQRQEETR